MSEHGRQSSFYQALNRLVDGGIDEFVRSRRQRNMSWRDIADELSLAAGSPVSHQTIFRWFPDSTPRRTDKAA